MARYHTDIGFPANMQEVPRTLELYPTRHVLERIQRYKYPPRLPRVLDTDRARLIVAEVDDDGSVTWCLWRLSYTDHSDLALVVDVRTGNIVTAWKNTKTDQHGTLNRHLYAEPKVNKLSLDA